MINMNFTVFTHFYKRWVIEMKQIFSIYSIEQNYPSLNNTPKNSAQAITGLSKTDQLINMKDSIINIQYPVKSF